MLAKQMRARRMRSLALVTAVAAVLAASSARPGYAGSEQRKGTSGATELRIPVGPRGSALGGGVVGDIAGIEALFFNPAGLAVLEGTEAMFSNTQYFADMKLNYAAIGTRAGFGSIAASAKILSIGDVFVTTEDAPDGTGEVLRPTFTVLGVTWARQFTDRVMFGAGLNYLNERILSTSASGVAFDFGVQYLTGLRGLQFGMAMKNFGAGMKFEGENLQDNFRPPDTDPQSSNRTFSSNTATFELPSYFTLGATYDIGMGVEQKLLLMSAFQNNNFAGDQLSGGAEWSYRRILSLRGSYFASFRTNTNTQTGEESSEIDSGDDLYSGYAFGAGLKLKTGGSGLGIDVAYRPVRDFFDDVIEVGLKLKF